MRATQLTRATALIGGMIGVGFLAFAADYQVLLEERSVGLFFLMILIWTVLPFVLIYRFAPSVSSSKAASKVLLWATFAAAALSAFFYWYALFGNPDPQGGLIFLVLPPCQLIGYLFIYPICQMVQERYPDRSEK